MRAIYKFGKTEKVMYVSHLDLQRFMQMALRRTQLPAAYSQGFNPHPQMSFASALATGWTSEAELVDIKMASPIDDEFAFTQMSRALPPDIPLLGVRLVEDSFPALMSKLAMAEYTISFIGAYRFRPFIDEFMGMESFMAVRKTKSAEKLTNIRPMAMSVSCVGENAVFARLMLTETLTLKPDLLIKSLCEIGKIDYPPDVKIHRTKLLASSDRTEGVDLFTYNP